MNERATTTQQREFKMKNSDVVRSWAFGHPAATANLLTDGDCLYSYRKLIGFTVGSDKVCLDYMASGVFVSQTTSCHVSLAKRNCDEVMHPLAYAEMIKLKE
jgi:hypothetical protein